MDPVSAFSLACNVIQVVDFSFKLAAGCREIYASGSLEKNDHIELVANNLERISEEIAIETAARPIGDKELTNLASKSAATSKKLLSVLKSIKMKNQKSKRSAFGKTVSAMWKKSVIDDLQKQLESYQKVLETRMLKGLCDQFDLSSLQQKHTFASLDQSIQNMIQGLADGHTRISDLISTEAADTRIHITREMGETRKNVAQEGADTRKHVTDEAEAGRVNIDDKFSLLKITQANESHLKAVRDSLFFSDIHSRQETIKEAHKDTFQWIFETNSQQTQPWSNFVEWLKTGQGIYWISGKAGSGKSTLMNYISAEDRTREVLNYWAGNRKLLTPTFFFWNAGSTLQKNTGGLLRSLLFQLLEQRPFLASVAAQSPIPTWTDSRLLKTLLKIIREEIHDDAICFFIDGLDEFEGEQQDLIVLVNGIEQHSNVKFCVSSRYLPAFQRSFGSAPRLKLEDLSREDIAKLVNDKLGSTSAAEFANELIDRAHGVFLWVDLAVKDVLRGVDNEDSSDELWQRLKSLPLEIGDLYLHMLKRLDKVYQEPAKNFLRLMVLWTRVKRYEEITLLDFALAAYDRADAIIASSFQDLDLEYLVAACRKLKTQIPIRCTGLLELDAPQFDESRNSEQQSAAYAELAQFQEHSRINFIHVSAYDFLLKDKKGIDFMNTNRNLDIRAATQLYHAKLAQFRLLFPSSKLRKHENQIRHLLSLVREISDLGEPIDLLLDKMNNLFTNIQDSWNESTSRSTQRLEYWFTDASSDYLDSVFVPTSLAYAERPHGHTKPSFLGFAAWNSFSDYVCKKLDQLPQVEAREIASHMLLLALISATASVEYMPKLKCADQILRSGADGGMVFGVGRHHDVIQPAGMEKHHRVTGWKVFLDLLSLDMVFRQHNQEPDHLLAQYSSLAHEFLSQPIDPSICAEVLLFLVKSSVSQEDFFMARDISTLAWNGNASNRLPGLVVSMSPALFLDYLPGSCANKLPPEMRTNRFRRVTQVLGAAPMKLCDLSEAQSDYLMEAFAAWLPAHIPDRYFESVESKLAESTLRDRLCEVFGEFGLDDFGRIRDYEGHAGDEEDAADDQESADEEYSVDEEDPADEEVEDPVDEGYSATKKDMSDKSASRRINSFAFRSCASPPSS